MFNTKPNTAELEGTLVKLDTLYSSFNTLLVSAQDQLAALELSDADLQRMVPKLTSDTAFLAAIRSRVTTHVLSSLNSDENSDILKRITTSVMASMESQLTFLLQTRLEELYRESLSSDKFDKAIEAKICESRQMQDSFTISEGLKALISKATSTDEPQQRTAE